LVWLNPRPVPEDVGKAYKNYLTHVDRGHRRKGLFREKAALGLYAANRGYSQLAEGWAWRLLGKALRLLPPMREIGTLGIMCLEGTKKGRLLDIGCGNGCFLALMRDAGWEVLGVDTDPVGAQLAQERRGVPVIVGTLADARLPADSFDAVTLDHVIEHVHDPFGLLAESYRVLRPGGLLVLTTPNVASLCHKLFHECWVHLDPPRHLYLFSLSTLKVLGQRCGLHISLLRTSSRVARWTWAASLRIKEKATFSGPGVDFRSTKTGWGLYGLEYALQSVWQEVGEEVVLVGSRGEARNVIPEGGRIVREAGSGTKDVPQPGPDHPCL
jgi:SAM-dependent methyltransferase